MKAFEDKCLDPDLKGSFSNCTRILKDSYGKAKTCETCVPEPFPEPECDQITPPNCGPDCQLCGCPEWGQTCTLPGLPYCPPIECPPTTATAPTTTAEPTCQENQSKESCELDGCVWCGLGGQCGCVPLGECYCG